MITAYMPTSRYLSPSSPSSCNEGYGLPLNHRARERPRVALPESHLASGGLLGHRLHSMTGARECAKVKSWVRAAIFAECFHFSWHASGSRARLSANISPQSFHSVNRNALPAARYL